MWAPLLFNDSSKWSNGMTQLGKEFYHSSCLAVTEWSPVNHKPIIVTKFFRLKWNLPSLTAMSHAMLNCTSQIRYAGGKKKKVKAKLLVNIIVCSYNIINWLFVTKRVKKNQLIKQWQTIRKMKDKTSDSDLEFSGETVSL